jgi:hypothetical protein
MGFPDAESLEAVYLAFLLDGEGDNCLMPRAVALKLGALGWLWSWLELMNEPNTGWGLIIARRRIADRYPGADVFVQGRQTNAALREFVDAAYAAAGS